MYVSEKGSSTHEKECRITVAKHGSGPVSLRKSTSQVGGLGKHKNSVADAVKDSKFSSTSFGSRNLPLFTKKPLFLFYLFIICDGLYWKPFS